MLKQVNILMTPETHRRLKSHAALQGMNIGAFLRKLIADYEGFPKYSDPKYRAWVKELLRIGRVQGDAAAEKYMEENPFRG